MDSCLVIEDVGRLLAEPRGDQLVVEDIGQLVTERACFQASPSPAIPIGSITVDREYLTIDGEIVQAA